MSAYSDDPTKYFDGLPLAPDALQLLAAFKLVELGLSENPTFDILTKEAQGVWSDAIDAADALSRRMSALIRNPANYRGEES